MKKFFSAMIFWLMPYSLFAVGGLGLQLGQGIFSVDTSSPETNVPGVTLTNGAFDGSINLGGYVYIDLIPFIDVEFDFNMISNTYDIEFQNELGSMPPISFSWGSVNTYTTVRRKVAGLSIPFLAAAKAHAGLGVNSHSTLPVADVDMVKSLLNGNLEADPSDLDQALLGYLENDDNIVKSSGFHVQAGLQFKLLMLDSFLMYRHTFVEDVVPGAKGFGALSLRFGFGL